MLRARLPVLLALFGLSLSVAGGTPRSLNLWPSTPPGDENLKLPAEANQSKPGERLVAGRPVVRLGNVSTPLVEVYQPPKDKANGAAVIICPGGGRRILAWDLEGLEVAEWLNGIGVTGVVLKYRVPARTKEQPWKAAVQDGQRALALTRAHAAEWGVDPRRVGIMGFSAGGEAAGLTALKFAERQYAAVDAADQQSCRPDFALLIYPAYFHEPKTNQLQPHVVVPSDAPPMFLVQAWNDNVPVQNSLLLALALKQQKVPVELHVYPTGGHGYGLRRTEEPITKWPDLAATWLRQSGWLAARKN